MNVYDFNDIKIELNMVDTSYVISLSNLSAFLDFLEDNDYRGILTSPSKIELYLRVKHLVLDYMDLDRLKELTDNGIAIREAI